MTERRQQERRTGYYERRRMERTEREIPTGRRTLGSDRRQQASGAARNVAMDYCQQCNRVFSPDNIHRCGFPDVGKVAASCETTATGEGRATRDEILAEIRNDPANTLFGLPLSEIARLINEDKQRKATPSPTRTQPATDTPPLSPELRRRIEKEMARLESPPAMTNIGAGMHAALIWLLRTADEMGDGK